MKYYLLLPMLLMIYSCGHSQNGTQTAVTGEMISTEFCPDVKPVNFVLLDEPDITKRKGSVHFITIGEDKYTYKGKIKTNQGVIKARMESVPTVLVSYNNEMYMLGRSYFTYDNQFDWFPVQNGKINDERLFPFPDHLYFIVFGNKNINFLYKMSCLMQKQKASASASLRLFKTYLNQSPDFLFFQPHGSYYMTYISDLACELKKDSALRPEIYGTLKDLLYRFPKNCREGDLSKTAQTLIDIDSVQGSAEVKSFAFQVEESVKHNPGVADNRLLALKPWLTKIRISEILNTDLYLEFRKMCESQKYIYETYHVDYADKKQDPEDGGLYYKRPAANLEGLDFKEGNGFHIALMYNRGNPFMEIKLASAYYTGVLPHNKTYILSPRRTFTQEETAQIIRSGTIPEEIFTQLETQANKNTNK